MAVVLVAGTNGKGSTAALLASMATVAGYRTGLYSSPYLEDPEEQVRVDGRAVSGEALARLLVDVLCEAGSAPAESPTLFEAMTAAALVHFAREGCHLAILEAGMGGRRDATNATEPVLSIVTSVGLDHRDYLGADILDIAREKAGVFRPGRPGLLGPLRSADAEAVIRSAASRLGAPLITARERASLLAWEPRGWEGQRIAFQTPVRHYSVDLPLLGEHQAWNLVLATLAAESLQRMGWPGFTPEAIAAGAMACRWPGRLEAVALPQGSRVVLDAAHNAQGVEALVRFLDQSGESFDLLFGALEDKDAAGMLSVLASRARRLWLTSPGGPRARDPHDLTPLLAGRSFVVEPGLEAALDLALASSPPVLVACGSIVLLGRVRRHLYQRFGVPEPAVAITTGPRRRQSAELPPLGHRGTIF